MSRRARPGRHWLGVALLVPGVLILDGGPALAQRDSKKAPSKAQIQPKAETALKVVGARPKPEPKSQAKRPAPKPEPAVARAQPLRAARPSDVCVHVVRSGESLSRVASRHGVSRQSLMSANSIGKAGTVRTGQRLKVPGCRPTETETAEVQMAGAPRATQTAALEPISVQSDSLVARVGPRRVPTRLYIAIPDFTGEVDFMWPVDGPVLSGFGRRRGGWHAGVDIRADRGTPIRAAAAGVVISSGWEIAYGNIVRIEHPNGFVTVYAHNHENLVQVGDQVDADTVIATVGRTGRASGDHLHFEIRRDGMAYNPSHLLDPREAPVMVAGPYNPPPTESIPVSSYAPSQDDFEHP